MVALFGAVNKVGRFWVYRSINLYACSLFTALPLCQGSGITLPYETANKP